MTEDDKAGDDKAGDRKVGDDKTGDRKVGAESFSARLIRREAERRAALELTTSTPAGLESALARISAEVTAEAAEAKDKDR